MIEFKRNHSIFTEIFMSKCYLCPRMCGVDRDAGQIGVCKQGSSVRISRASLHAYEEPPISGTQGSGAVFFSGCSLRCVFCQNRDISRGINTGEELTTYELSEVFLRLQGEGAHNINLVTPTHFSDKIAEALKICRPKLSIPVVYNTSGYERVEILRTLDGLIDIYMPDFKYASAEIATEYSSAPDYPKVCAEAIAEMFRQVGKYEYDDNGLLRRGLLIRHLCLPSRRADSMKVFDILSTILPPDQVLISLMSQYTPEFYTGERKELQRRITSFEYESILSHVRSLGFDGFMQGRASASSVYTPDFKK